MVYIQHSYRRVVHTFIGKSPFENCYGYFPSSLFDITYRKQAGERDDLIGDSLTIEKFGENMR